MKEQVREEIKEIQGDCSNCGYRKDVAPYSVILGCWLDGKTYSQPYTCTRWKSMIWIRIK